MKNSYKILAISLLVGVALVEPGIPSPQAGYEVQLGNFAAGQTALRPYGNWSSTDTVSFSGTALRALTVNLRPETDKTTPAPRIAWQARKSYAVWLTAYSSSPDETDDTPFITASGKYVRDGIIASNFLPFGTKVKIPALFGDKIFTVEDRLHARFSDRMDIWMPSKAAAFNFGKRYAEVVVVTPLVALGE